MKKIVLICILLGLWGCSSKQAVMSSYTLSMSTSKMVSGVKFKYKTIKVTYPKSLRDKSTHKMQYSYSSMEQGYYQDSQWSNNIGKMLQGLFMQTLESSRVFKAVLPYSSTALEDYRLESNIFDFSHHVRGNLSHAVVSIQFNLISRESGRLVKSRRFSYREVTQTTDAQGYAKATNIALRRLNIDLMRWLN